MSGMSATWSQSPESEDVRSEEVEVAISGRNVGRGRARGRSRGERGTTLVVGETSTAGQGRGEGVKIPFCSVIIELLTFCRSGIGQCVPTAEVEPKVY